MLASDIPGDVALLAGPQLFGHLFNYGLFGILTVQVYYYHITFPRDPLRLKYLSYAVYALYIVESIQIVMATHDAYQVLGAGWGNTDALKDVHWLWFDSPVITGIVSAVVQCYFSWRIHVLSASSWLSGSICLIAIFQACAAIATGIMSRVLHNPAEFKEKTLGSHAAWLVGSATCDLLIAGSMLYLLSRAKHGTASDALLSRLIRLVVETGSLTASVACLDLILFVAFRNNNLHLAPALVLTKVYTNTLLMMVNSRARIREIMWNQEGRLNAVSPLQWVVDPSNADGSEQSEQRDGAEEFTAWKVPVIEVHASEAGDSGGAIEMVDIIRKSTTSRSSNR